MGVAQTVRVPKAAPQRPLTEAVVITIVVELAVEYHIPDGKVRVEVGVGVGTVLSSVLVDLIITLPLEVVVLEDLMRTLPAFDVLVGATEHVENFCPCAETQAAVGDAHTVRVPEAAPHRLFADAVVMTIVVEAAAEYHIPEGRVDVDGAGVMLAEDEVLTEDEVEAGPAQVEKAWPLELTQRAVGEAQIVLVPPPAPQRLLREAVVMAIVVALLLESQTPVCVAVIVDVEEGALVDVEDGALVDVVTDEEEEDVATLDEVEEEVELPDDVEAEELADELEATTYETPLTLGLAAHVES